MYLYSANMQSEREICVLLVSAKHNSKRVCIECVREREGQVI